MKSEKFKKGAAIVIAFFLFFGLFNGIFIKQINAAGAAGGGATMGAAVGQAVGAGIACFLADKASAELINLLSEVKANAEVITPTAGDPAIVGGTAAVAGFAAAGVASGPPVSDNATHVQFVGLATILVGIDMNNVVHARATADKNQTGMFLGMAKGCIRDVVVKQVLDWIVDMIVDWIQNGGDLKSRFVTDWHSFQKDAFNAGVGAIVNNSTFAFLCSPFRLQMKLYFMPVQKFHNQITCTLNKIVKNINDFSKNFKNGGWLAYSETWNPQNNFYGSIMLISDEAVIQGRNAEKAGTAEALAGAGFLSMKRCKEGGYPTLEEAQEKYKETDSQFTKTSNGYCPNRLVENTTPGKVVGELAVKGSQMDLEWQNNVTSWVAAITNALINRLLKEGLAHMSKSTAPESPGGTLLTITPADLSMAGYFAAQVADQATSTAQQIVDAASGIIPIKQASLGYATSSLTLLQKIQSIQIFYPTSPTGYLDNYWGGRLAFFKNIVKTASAATSCQPPVTNADVSDTDAKISALNQEIEKLFTIQDTAQFVIDDLSNPDLKPDEITKIYEEFNTFMNQNSKEIQALKASNAVSLAEKERDDWKAKYESLKSEWSACSGSVR